jgi:hypothetical protein
MLIPPRWIHEEMVVIKYLSFPLSNGILRDSARGGTRSFTMVQGGTIEYLLWLFLGAFDVSLKPF